MKIQKEIDLDFVKDLVRFIEPAKDAEHLKDLETLLSMMDNPEKAMEVFNAGLRSVEDDPTIQIFGRRDFLKGLMAGIALTLGSSSERAAILNERLLKRPDNVANFAEARAKV